MVKVTINFSNCFYIFNDLPMWDDSQQILHTLFTPEEMEQVLTKAAEVLPGRQLTMLCQERNPYFWVADAKQDPDESFSAFLDVLNTCQLSSPIDPEDLANQGNYPGLCCLVGP